MYFHLQWNLIIKDTLGPRIFIKRLSTIWRFKMYWKDMKFIIWDQ